jgi:hypothetical protein
MAIRPFIDTLTALRYGELHDELSEKLNELVAACRRVPDRGRTGDRPMNRYALALLLTMIAAGLLGSGSADNDPAQQRVEKPVPVTATKE